MASHVRNYQIDYQGAPRISGDALAKIRIGFSEPGDAVLTHKGSVGRAALNSRRCVLTPQTTYYRCNGSLLDSRFLVYYFTSSPFYRQISAIMAQTTRDYAPISEQYLLFLIVPPIEEQKEVVRRVEALFALADRIEQRLDIAIARAGRITQAVLSKAFRGELVPTEAELARQEGREYEPAVALLERIHRESPPESSDGRKTGRKSGARAGVGTAKRGM